MDRTVNRQRPTIPRDEASERLPTHPVIHVTPGPGGVIDDVAWQTVIEEILRAKPVTVTEAWLFLTRALEQWEDGGYEPLDVTALGVKIRIGEVRA